MATELSIAAGVEWDPQQRRPQGEGVGTRLPTRPFGKLISTPRIFFDKKRQRSVGNLGWSVPDKESAFCKLREVVTARKKKNRRIP